jgi:hypothetical protein
VNITYEDVKRAADANRMTVEATLAIIPRTADKDRRDQPEEYSAKKVVADQRVRASVFDAAYPPPASSPQLSCQLLGLCHGPTAGKIAADEGGGSAVHRETAVQQIQHARPGVADRQDPVRLETHSRDL